MSSTPLSLLDFCSVYEGESASTAIARSVRLAQEAERLGFFRIWYTEHHNMPSIASSSPAVMIAHIGAHTTSIRLGAGGVMLPNHAPYVVAEQFGALAEMYPDRIDLGLGRAPGTDAHTLGRALRRDELGAERFPEDVKELAAFLSEVSPIPGVTAFPGAGTQVPLYILGSSLFGASLAAKLGLPYAFASHFAPELLDQATSYYREHFQPSAQLAQPYVIAGVNVLAHNTTEEATAAFEKVTFERVRRFAGRKQKLSDAQIEQIVHSPHGRRIIDMLQYSAVGTTAEVADYLTDFQEKSHADELMVSLLGTSDADTFRGLELVSTYINK
ncbi:MAG: LLM class flavin-dependent oxidoreductase [Corynebacterium sp.]|nr:LLM class flavin-dependent oxidoreductase [Corynebacterium sp.]